MNTQKLFIWFTILLQDYIHSTISIAAFVDEYIWLVSFQVNYPFSILSIVQSQVKDPANPLPMAQVTCLSIDCSSI